MLTLRGPGSKAARLAELLTAESEEFRVLWNEQEVGIRPREIKRYQHPRSGAWSSIAKSCWTLTSHTRYRSTPVAGSESYEKLQLLPVIGAPSSV